MNITSYMLKQETPSKETEGKAPESLPFLKPETFVETPTAIESRGPVKEATFSVPEELQGQAQPVVPETQAPPAPSVVAELQAAADNAAEAETQQLPD